MASRRHDDTLSTRAEPYVGDDLLHGAVDPAVSEWARKAAMQEQKEWSRRRSWFKPFTVAAVFTVGAVAGVGVAWWFSQAPPLVPQHAATEAVAISDASSSPSATRQGMVLGNRRGINPGELPYDGMPPREASPQPTIAARGTSPAELPYGDSGSSALRIDAPPVSSAPLQPTLRAQTGEPADAVRMPPVPAGPASRSESPTSAPAQASAKVQSFQARRMTEPVPAASPALPRKTEAANGTDKRLAQQKSTSDARDARGAKDEKGGDRKTAKRPGNQHNMKDKEIERIRRQAAEELQRKAQAERSQEEAGLSSRRTAAESPAAIMRAKLARCEAASNFIFREQCKWQLCSGKWGRNGCPSYQTQASTY